jgi:hypothetical protein
MLEEDDSLEFKDFQLSTTDKESRIVLGNSFSLSTFSDEREDSIKVDRLDRDGDDDGICDENIGKIHDYLDGDMGKDELLILSLKEFESRLDDTIKRLSED